MHQRMHKNIHLPSVFSEHISTPFVVVGLLFVPRTLSNYNIELVFKKKHIECARIIVEGEETKNDNAQ